MCSLLLSCLKRRCYVLNLLVYRSVSLYVFYGRSVVTLKLNRNWRQKKMYFLTKLYTAVPCKSGVSVHCLYYTNSYPRLCQQGIWFLLCLSGLSL